MRNRSWAVASGRPLTAISATAGAGWPRYLPEASISLAAIAQDLRDHRAASQGDPSAKQPTEQVGRWLGDDLAADQAIAGGGLGGLGGGFDRIERAGQREVGFAGEID